MSMHGSNSGSRLTPLALLLGVTAGCHTLPVEGVFQTGSMVHGSVHTDSTVAGAINAKVDVRLPSVADPGPLAPVVLRPSPSGPAAPRVALIDVDGLILNQAPTGPYSAGENPVSVFREKLEAAAADPRVRALVVRINSPGGGVTASDILAEDLRRFRQATGKPAVACLMDLATGGAYYLAVGCDRVIAHPTSIVGGVGALVNHYNLQDAMAQLNIRAEPIKSGELVDMGSVTGPLPDEAATLLQGMVDGFRDRFLDRVVRARPALTAKDRERIADGRVMPASEACARHLVDALGYIDDAIREAERLAHASGSEVILYHRAGQPARSVYATTPNVPLQGDLIPFSYPGLDRAKLPTFLYLWQPDPTITRLGGR
jgi:protease-4